MRYSSFFLLLILAVSFSGCGKKGTVTNSPAINRPVQQNLPMAERPVKQPVKILISIKNNKFLPQVITAQVGDTVEWTNEDTAPHTVTGGELNSARLAKGESYTVTLTKPGTIDYSCGIHPDMKGQVVVREAQ